MLLPFKVVILETGGKWLGIGAVDGQYNTRNMPGWYRESVGYHTDDGKIFHNFGIGVETKGKDPHGFGSHLDG